MDDLIVTMTQERVQHFLKCIKDMNTGVRKRGLRPSGNKRPHSCIPIGPRTRGIIYSKKPDDIKRRCQSLSPLPVIQKKMERLSNNNNPGSSAPESINIQKCQTVQLEREKGKEPVLPQCVLIKLMRSLATRKREFIKLRKSVMLQQNTLLELYASLKEMELRTGSTNEDSLGDVRVLSLSGWPAHDLLLLVRDDLEMSLTSEISGLLGPQILQQLHAQLIKIPEEVLGLGTVIMTSRVELLNLLQVKHRNDRSTYQTNVEWKTKNIEFDNETEKLNRMIEGVVENLKAKIKHSLELAKIPWLDRETMMKKNDRLQKENLILQHKIEENTKKEIQNSKESGVIGSAPTYQALSEELSKERSGREALKEVVSTAENMLRVARARIANLERHLKETRAELEAARRKHKDLEQLVKALEHSQKTYRHKESSHDARSKKLLDVTKTGEITVEALSQQRDALELRVKELRDQAEVAEHAAKVREAEMRARADSLQGKVVEQERKRIAAEARVLELDTRVKDLEDQLLSIRKSSMRLADMERRNCLQYIPAKESEPSDRETEIWKELQVTRAALGRAEEELQQSRADKDNFLNSLSRIAQGEGADNLQDKMATEILDRERKIVKLQQVIAEQRENKRNMEKSLNQYENQLASLRFEVKRLRNYDCYTKEIPHQELQTELLELHMQVATLSRERTSLVTAAATKALMLERHERAADLFASVVRARRELVAILDGNNELPPKDESTHAEVSRSLSSMCAYAADTWSALRAERARMLRLQSALLEQSQQLEREGRMRIQLERCLAILEREVVRAHHSSSADHWVVDRNMSLAPVIYNKTPAIFGIKL